MSANSRKGYTGEVGALELLAPLAPGLHRPRTTSHRATDTGDVHGLPLVVSVKNQPARQRLAEWVDELVELVGRSEYPTGILVVKRAGTTDPQRWYVVTTGALALPLLAGYLGSLDK